MRVGYSIQVRCGCRGNHGERLGQACPKLWRKDGTWNSKHGSAGFAMRVPTGSGVRLLKRYGFASKADAKAAVDRVSELLSLAGAGDSIRARVGDMIVSASRNGGQLPEVADMRRRIGVGADPAAPAAMFAEAWQSWLSGKKRLRQSARERLEQIGHHWLIPVLADVPVERLNAGHCAAVFERIERINSEIAARSDGSRACVYVSGDVRSQPRLVGVATQHRIYAALREFCNFEVRKTRRMSFNPIYAIELEPEERQEANRWSAGQAAQFLSQSADEPLALLFRFVLLRGARRGEACGFRWSGADLDAGYLTVARPLLLIGANVVEGKPKTQAGERQIWLDDRTIALLLGAPPAAASRHAWPPVPAGRTTT